MHNSKLRLHKRDHITQIVHHILLWPTLAHMVSHMDPTYIEYTTEIGKSQPSMILHKIIGNTKKITTLSLINKNLTLLGKASLISGRGTRPLKLPHFVAKDGGKFLYSLVDDERGKISLTIVFGEQLSELFPLYWTARVVVRLEQHVADYFCYKLVLFLRKK